MDIPLPVLGMLLFFSVIVGAVFLIGLTKKWGILLPYAGMLLFSSMSKPVDWFDRVVPTIWLPVQSIRSKLFLASGIAGMLVVLMQLHRLRRKGQSASVWLLVTAGFYASMLRFAHDTAAEGVMSILFTFFTLIPLALTAALVMDKVEDIMILFRTVLFVNAIWIGMVLVQFVVNPSYVTSGKEQRFVGILSNPQHTGVLMAFFAVISLWVYMNDSKRYRVLYFGIVGLNFLFLLWSGSRTGLGMGMIGVSAVLYARAGRAILLVPIVGITTYGAAKFLINVVGIDLGFSRLGSTSDTRTHAWISLIETGMDNLGIGIGTYESSFSENSWLYGFAAYGAGMLILLLILTLFAMVEVLKTVRLRVISAPEYRPIFDITLGLIGMYFAGAVLEGFMVARVSAALCFYPLIAGAAAVIRKQAVEVYADEYFEENGEENEEGGHDHGRYDEYADYGKDYNQNNDY